MRKAGAAGSTVSSRPQSSLLCEVPGCDSHVRIVPGMGVVCEDGHAYHTVRMRTIENPADYPHPPAAVVAPQPSGPLRMPFGRYEGKLIEEVPTGYITWALETIERLGPGVRTEMEAQLEMRAGRGVVRKTAATQTPQPPQHPQTPTPSVLRRRASTRPSAAVRGRERS